MKQLATFLKGYASVLTANYRAFDGSRNVVSDSKHRNISRNVG